MAGVKGHRRGSEVIQPEPLRLSAAERALMMENLLRRCLSEAIPDAQIGAIHTDKAKAATAHESLVKFRREVNAVLNATVVTDEEDESNFRARWGV